MSYCVQCGVELEKSLERCPLCNTPVLNPNTPDVKYHPSPYPAKKGQVDTVKRTDLAVLISVILGGTAFACGMLNLLVYQSNHWSFYVIGACLLFWVVFTPALLYSKLNTYFMILIDGIGIALYIGIVAYEFPNAAWYPEVAIPLVALLTLMCEVLFVVRNKISRSILVPAIVICIELAVTCVSLELLVRNHLERHLYITWSSIILTCCAVIAAVLFTIIRRARLREELRRRMHM